MSDRLIVHVGLPKTATTTLQQEVFPRLATGHVSYLGVQQPRAKKDQNELYKRFCSAVNGEASHDSVKTTLIEEMNRGKTLLLSEEMFTVTEGSNCWQAKLRRLGRLLAGLNYVVVVTVREPSAALFSYYAELCGRASKHGDFLECALQDDAMKIYHYGVLSRELLENFDKSRIFILKFEDIIKGHVGEFMRLIAADQLDAGTMAFGRRNHRQRKNGKIIVRHQKSLLDITRYPLGKVIKRDTALYALIKTIFQPASTLFKRVTVTKTTALPEPRAADLVYLRSVLRDETVTLQKQFGVTYE